MTSYAMFQEIVNEIKTRPEADPVGILEEYVGPLVDLCSVINIWLGDNLLQEPPWYMQFIIELARYDVDLTPIWLEARRDCEKLEAVRR